MGRTKYKIAWFRKRMKKRICPQPWVASKAEVSVTGNSQSYNWIELFDIFSSKYCISNFACFINHDTKKL